MVRLRPHAPPPPPLMDELVEECLLRLPPDDPANLVRVALVCKGWRRIVADRGFGRRFRELHRRPPMLGFLHIQEGKGLCFKPTSSFRPRNDDLLSGYTTVMDSRHGRVLLRSWPPSLARGFYRYLVVWDPISGAMLELPELPPPRRPPPPQDHAFNSRAAVLCASTACDHLDCRRGHFLVVFMDACLHEVCVYVYSSKAGAWIHSTSASQDFSDPRRLLHLQPVAMAGNALYFIVHRKMTTEIIKYDLGAHEISWFDDLPPDCSKRSFQNLLTTTEHGGWGIARVEKDFKLKLWSREAGPNGVLGWAPSGVIELQTTLPANSGSIKMITFEHGLGAFFITTNAGAFTVDLMSNRVRKVLGNLDVRFFVPYTSFSTPALGAALTGKGPTAGVPSA